MLTDDELLALYREGESDRVEFKESWSAREKIHQTICAFANDLPDHKLPSVVFVGVKDNGQCANLTIDDELLSKMGNCRTDGRIEPFPSLVVQKKVLDECELAVIIVEPSHSPPVRFHGTVWVRIGPRRGRASRDDERILSEKRRYKDSPFDLRPLYSSSVEDLDLELFRRIYLPSAVSPDVIEENDRPMPHQLASLRIIDNVDSQKPTVVGILTVGKTPREHIYGAYVQFLRVDGIELGDPIIDQKEVDGALPDLLRLLESLIEINITTRSEYVSQPIEIKQPDYPIEALRQLIRNAVLHRNYESTHAPIQITWFNDRIEITNPGGLYGQVNESNLGEQGVNDYRNPHIATVMKNLGYVQRFGSGIPIARKAIERNGNPPIEFYNRHNRFHVIIRKGA